MTVTAKQVFLRLIALTLILSLTCSACAFKVNAYYLAAPNAKKFEYIVPLENKHVYIIYEMDLIVAQKQIADGGLTITDTQYAIYDFNGNIITDFGKYSFIDGCAIGGQYILANDGEREVYLDKTGKEAALPEDTKLQAEEQTDAENESQTDPQTGAESESQTAEQAKTDRLEVPKEAASADAEYERRLALAKQALAANLKIAGVDGLSETDTVYDIGNGFYEIPNSGGTARRIVNTNNPEAFDETEYESVQFADNAAVNGNKILWLKKDGKYAAATYNGEILSPFKGGFTIASELYTPDFTENLVQIYTEDENGNRKYGFADELLNIKIPMDYYFVSGFSEGLCGVTYAETGVNGNVTTKGGYIGTNNNFVIKLKGEISYAGKFSEGLAQIGRGTSPADRHEYIDKTGQTVIQSNDWANSLGDFKEGIAVVSNYVSGGTPTSNAFANEGVIKYTGEK
jgi:hypothetical protein